jgi:hypothetical protein
MKLSSLDGCKPVTMARPNKSQKALHIGSGSLLYTFPNLSFFLFFFFSPCAPSVSVSVSTPVSVVPSVSVSIWESSSVSPSASSSASASFSTMHTVVCMFLTFQQFHFFHSVCVWCYIPCAEVDGVAVAPPGAPVAETRVLLLLFPAVAVKKEVVHLPVSPIKYKIPENGLS